MNKFLLPLLALCAFLFAAVAYAEQPDVPADGIEMKNTKNPVVFNHTTHKEIACGSCHHKVEGKENYGKCASAGCHDSFDRKDKSVKGYYRVMHAKDMQYASCVSCHIETIKDKQDDAELKKALTACKGSKCHPAK